MSNSPDVEHEARTGEICSRIGTWEGGDQHDELIDIKVGETFPTCPLLETTGRITGRAQRSRVCDGLVGRTFWLVAQFGQSTEYVQDIEDNPRVRVLVRSGPLRGWRSGTAHILDDDDPRERTRMLEEGDFWRRLCVRTSAALGTNLLTVRVDLDPAASRSRKRAPGKSGESARPAQ
jgi:F420H(2)-dependent quinone reductase